jgi:hypothetical protein
VEAAVATGVVVIAAAAEAGGAASVAVVAARKALRFEGMTLPQEMCL